MSTVEVPQELESLRDAAVAFAHGKLKKCPDLEPLQEWFENGGGWDDVVMAIQGSGIYFESVADQYFSDAVMRHYIDLEKGQRISKSKRLEYARDRLSYEFSQADDSLHAVQISSDPATFLACFIEGQGQGGWEVFWLGTFTSTEELTDIDDCISGFVIDEKLITDQMILDLWKK